MSDIRRRCLKPLEDGFMEATGFHEGEDESQLVFEMLNEAYNAGHDHGERVGVVSATNTIAKFRDCFYVNHASWNVLQSVLGKVRDLLAKDPTP